MSAIALILLGSIAAMLARTTLNHSLVLAFVLVGASASWASPSSAADARRLDQPDRSTALTLARTTDGVRSVIGELTVKAQ